MPEIEALTNQEIEIYPNEVYHLEQLSEVLVIPKVVLHPGGRIIVADGVIDGILEAPGLCVAKFSPHRGTASSC